MEHNNIFRPRNFLEPIQNLNKDDNSVSDDNSENFNCNGLNINIPSSERFHTLQKRTTFEDGFKRDISLKDLMMRRAMNNKIKPMNINSPGTNGRQNAFANKETTITASNMNKYSSHTPEDKAVSFHNDVSSNEIIRQMNMSNKIKLPAERLNSILRSESTNSIVDKLDINSEDNEEKLKNKNQKQRCMCSGNSTSRIRWDILIIIIAVWNGFSIPYNIAFYEDDEITNVGWTVANSILDVIFL